MDDDGVFVNEPPGQLLFTVRFRRSYRAGRGGATAAGVSRRRVGRALPVQQIVQVLRYPVQHVLVPAAGARVAVAVFAGRGRREPVGRGRLRRRRRLRLPVRFHVDVAHDDRRHFRFGGGGARRFHQTDFDAHVRGQHVGRRLYDAPDRSVAARRHVHEVRLHQLPVVRGRAAAVAVVRHRDHRRRRRIQQRRTTSAVTVVAAVGVPVRATRVLVAATTSGARAAVAPAAVVVYRLFVAPCKQTKIFLQ